PWNRTHTLREPCSARGPSVSLPCPSVSGSALSTDLGGRRLLSVDETRNPLYYWASVPFVACYGGRPWGQSMHGKGSTGRLAGRGLGLRGVGGDAARAGASGARGSVRRAVAYRA